MENKKGFTLLELLVVVVIIAILAGIAIPQYKLAVEKSHLTEAVVMLKAIAEAQDRFYIINGRYANAYEIKKLDVDIPGKKVASAGVNKNRIETQFFVYSPDADSGSISSPIPSGYKAVAHRKPLAKRFYIVSDKNNKLICKKKYSDITQLSQDFVI